MKGLLSCFYLKGYSKVSSTNLKLRTTLCRMINIVPGFTLPPDTQCALVNPLSPPPSEKEKKFT